MFPILKRRVKRDLKTLKLNFQPPSAAVFIEMHSASHDMRIYRVLKRVKEVGSLGRGVGGGAAEQKPATNGNIGSTIKQHAETTGHNIHPNYANILETGVKTKNNRLFLESLHSFLDKNCQ